MSAASAPPAAELRPAAASRTPFGSWGLRATAAGYLLVMIAVPILAILRDGLAEGLAGFWASVTQPVALDALRLTIVTALVMTAVNAVMGTLTAYVLVRYDFPG